MSRLLSSAGINSASKLIRKMFKTSIAALTAAPLLTSGAAFAPYVNLEMSGSYPDGAYSSGTLEQSSVTKGQQNQESVTTLLVAYAYTL